MGRRRVLVTGGAGFIGRHVLAALARDADEIAVLDDLSTGSSTVLDAASVRLIRRDVRDPRTVDDVRAFEPHVVLHLAAVHYIPDCLRDPERTLAINVGGTRNVVAGLRDSPVESVVLASTASVYGFSDEPLDERSPLRPSNVYGRSKRAAERVLTGFHRARPDVACTSARLFNVFGPGETNPHVIPRIVEQATRSPEVRVGHLWPKRDFVFVADVARALVSAASRRGGYAAVNIGTGVGTSVEDLLSTVGRALGTSIRPVRDPSAARAVDGHLVAEASRARVELGWVPRVGLEDGIREVVAAEAVA